MARSQRRAEGAGVVEAEMPIVSEAGNLRDMSVADLRGLIQQAERVLQEKVQAEKSAVIERVRSELSTYGLTQTDLFPQPGRRSRASSATGQKRASPPAKYRSPQGEEWSGRGVAPRWLRVAEAEGHKREEFLIER